MFKRVRRLVVSPVSEWAVISGEKTAIRTVVINYLLILLLIPAVSLILGWEFVGKTETYFQITTSTRGWDIGLHKAIVYTVTTLITIFASALVIDRIAPAFRVKKNFGNHLRLIIYSWTPVLISGVFYLVPSLSFMILAGFAYAFVLLYYGLDPVINPPGAGKTAFFVSIVAVVLSCYALTYVIIKGLIGLVLVSTTDLMPGNFVL